MTVVAIGEYELSLRARAIAARKRLRGKTTPNLTIRSITETPAEPEPVSDAAPIRAFEFDGTSPFEWRHIIHEVCTKHGLTFSEITGERREHRLVVARHEAFYRLSRETAMSLPMIGRRFSGRDHTTVLYGLRKHAERMEAEANSSEGSGFPPLSTLSTG